MTAFYCSVVMTCDVANRRHVVDVYDPASGLRHVTYYSAD